MSLLIKNAKIVNADGVASKLKDVLLEDALITRIDADIKDKTDQTIDAQGKLVFPGFIDLHVHLRYPGQEHKETIETGCRSAAKGGFTSVFCMPNTQPVVDNGVIVKGILHEARRAGLIHVYPIGAITKGQKGEELSDILELKDAGCLALSDDGVSVATSQMMRLALQYAKMADILLIEHCEDPSLRGGVMHEGYVSTEIGLKGLPGSAETIIVARDIELAYELKTKVHLAHISLKRAVQLIRAAKADGIAVTAEACPHHFCLTDEAVKDFDTHTKVNPPLRTQEDVLAVKQALKDGTIDCIATDHAPHTPEEKELGFDEAPFGMVGLETALGIVGSELVEQNFLSWAGVAEKMSFNPARISGLVNKGEIREGKDADITIVDPEQNWTVKKEDLVSKSKNSPFFGRPLKGRVVTTICNGKVVYPFVSGKI